MNLPAEIKIVHDDDFKKEDFTDCTDEVYFRLYHNLKNIGGTDCEEAEVVDVQPSDIDFFVDIINASYCDISVSMQQMQDYRKTSVYQPDLWILLKEKRTQAFVGCGIADFEVETGEASLEWIQVLPPYRGRGYGKMIVNTLLARMKGRAKFATVSGKADGTSHAERLYRRCGFTGNDYWHILYRKH